MRRTSSTRRRSLSRTNESEKLPDSKKECMRELAAIYTQQVSLMARQKKVTERLQTLMLENENLMTKAYDSDSSTRTWKQNENVNFDFWNKGEPRFPRKSSPIPQVFNNIYPSDSPRWKVVVGGCESDGDEEWVDNDCQSTPLIIALKKLQQRRGQIRGIKMWTNNLANLFYLADTNSSGLIDFDEYREMLEKLDISESLKNSLRTKFNNIDKDGSGAINLEEFLMFFLKFPKFKQELLTNSHNNAPYIYEKALSSCQRWRQWLYRIVECPEYNVVSKFLFCTDLLLVLIPITILCIEGVRPSYRVDRYKNFYMWCVSIFFLLEYLCGLFTCKHPKVLMLDPGHILDLASFLFWIIYNTIGRPGGMNPLGFIVFRTYRVVRLYNIFPFKTLEEDITIYIDTLTLAWTSYGAVTWLLLCAVIFFSLLVYVFERGEYDEETKMWLREDGDVSPLSNLYNCVYFILVTMTTLGYGDMSPKSYVGKLVAMVTVIVGLCNITFLINIVGDCFEEVFREFVLRRSEKMEKEQSMFVRCCVSKVSRQLSMKQGGSRISCSCIGQRGGSKITTQAEELCLSGYDTRIGSRV